MNKLIKYELKNRKKTIIYGGLSLLIINIMIVLFASPLNAYINTNDINVQTSNAASAKYMGILLPYIIFSFATLIAIFIDSIKILTDDLFNDTAYLLFSVPKKTSEILGAKVITSLIEYSFWLLITGFFGVMNIYNWITKAEIVRTAEEVYQATQSVIANLLVISVEFIVMLIIMYFTIILAKYILQNSRFRGGVTFLIFLLLYILEKNITGTVSSLFSTGETTLISTFAGILCSAIIALILFISASNILKNKINI